MFDRLSELRRTESRDGYPAGDNSMATTDHGNHDKVSELHRDQEGITVEMPVTFLNPRSSSLSSWREWLTEQAAFANVRVESLDEVLDILASATPPAS